MDIILTLPGPMAAFLQHDPCGQRFRERWAELDAGGTQVFFTADPPGARLGSGGGTVHALWEAWRQQVARGESISWDAWLQAAPKLVLHAGGQSRRLPAYAAVGKVFMPIPVMGGQRVPRLDQMLADFQIPRYLEVLREAGPDKRLLVASGDVWLDFDTTHVRPTEAPLVGLGMRVTPEVATDFGVFFVSRETPPLPGAPVPLARFEQKPSPERIYAQTRRFDFLVDTGMWLFSRRALDELVAATGGMPGEVEPFPDGLPGWCDLYGEIAPQLGTAADTPAGDTPWSALAAEVIALENGHFAHVGTTRQAFGFADYLRQLYGAPPRPLLVATPAELVTAAAGRNVIVDQVEGTTPLQTEGNNMIVGLPAEASCRQFASGVCLEVNPLPDGAFVARPYHVDDRFADDPAAAFCGQPLPAWSQARGLTLPSEATPYTAPLFPCLSAEDMTQAWLDWFFAREPDPELTAAWRKSRRLSAAELPTAVALGERFARSAAGHRRVFDSTLEALRRGPRPELMALDGRYLTSWLRAPENRDRAQALRSEAATLRSHLVTTSEQARFDMMLARLSEDATDAREHRDRAFATLRSHVIAEQAGSPALPRLGLKEDQIVWARSPVRIDFAGGWSDTPPFCFERGGAVLNLAIFLNGQPPVQVFVRRLETPRLVLHSIDQGTNEVISHYDQLTAGVREGSAFSLGKAALMLCGFHPDYLAATAPASLEAQLRHFGAGLEISYLAAVPRGSGLGTSSILGTTLLSALARACGHRWDAVELYRRVLAAEQMLTTGGGWQDQAGALYRGLKLIETVPGLRQNPTVRYVPDGFFGPEHVNRRILLYYTGVTRVAKNILADVVEKVFLGDAKVYNLIEQIKLNAYRLFLAFQSDDTAGVEAAIRRSWDCNRALDAGTSTPEIERILAAAGQDLVACKLAGAGGGGYLLMIARDAEAGRRLRERLERNPPNGRARFVDFAPADRGCEVSLS